MDCSESDTPSTVSTPEIMKPTQQVVKSTDTIKNNSDLIENCNEKRFSMKMDYSNDSNNNNNNNKEIYDNDENVTKSNRHSIASATSATSANTTTTNEGDLENGNVICEELLCDKVSEMNVKNLNYCDNDSECNQEQPALPMDPQEAALMSPNEGPLVRRYAEVSQFKSSGKWYLSTTFFHNI